MCRNKQRGFTLVELLTVIAIIAVLAAIIFPVMAGAKRKARESSCMTNLYQIYTAVKQFELDNHRYPDFIVGPVEFEYEDGTRVWYPDASTEPVPIEKATGVIDNRLVALYPEYIRSHRGLTCPDAILHGNGLNYDSTEETFDTNYTTSDYVDDPMFKYWEDVVGDGGEARSLRASGWVVDPNDPSSVHYPYKLYAYSSYDTQVPENLAEREGRYSPVWLFVDSSSAGYEEFLADNPDYDRQLWWRNPPDTVVITWCSYHRDEDSDGVPQGGSQDLVLFLDGRVKRVPSAAMADWMQGWLASPGG